MNIEVQRLFDGTEVAVEDAKHINHNPNPFHTICMSMIRHLVLQNWMFDRRTDQNDFE